MLQEIKEKLCHDTKGSLARLSQSILKLGKEDVTGSAKRVVSQGMVACGSIIRRRVVCGVFAILQSAIFHMVDENPPTPGTPTEWLGEVGGPPFWDRLEGGVGRLSSPVRGSEEDSEHLARLLPGCTRGSMCEPGG
jgi:hypothetical protein